MKKLFFFFTMLTLTHGVFAQPDIPTMQSILQSDIQIRTDTAALDAAILQMETLVNSGNIPQSFPDLTVTSGDDYMKYLNNLIYTDQQALIDDVNNQVEVSAEAILNGPASFSAVTQ
jgi:hypothetical protein